MRMIGGKLWQYLLLVKHGCVCCLLMYCFFHPICHPFICLSTQPLETGMHEHSQPLPHETASYGNWTPDQRFVPRLGLHIPGYAVFAANNPPVPKFVPGRQGGVEMSGVNSNLILVLARTLQRSCWPRTSFLNATAYTDMVARMPV